jgi:hypothetical protein
MQCTAIVCPNVEGSAGVHFSTPIGKHNITVADDGACRLPQSQELGLHLQNWPWPRD